MDFPESLAIEFCAVFGRFPRCEGLASVTDGFCIPEAHFDFRFEFFFGGFEFGKFCFYHFQLIAGREDVIANLNDFSLRMAGVFRDNVGYGGGVWRKQLLLDLERGQRSLAVETNALRA